MILTPWLNFKTNKAQKQNKALRKSVAYEAAGMFGIVYFNDDHKKIEEAEKLIALLKMDGKTVKAIAYEHKTSVKHLPYDTFNKENIGFWGSFIGKPINDFVEAEFDFLICLDEQPNSMIRSILANSHAKCRIGRFNENNEEVFEMLINNSEKQGKNWVDSLYQYLKILS